MNGVIILDTIINASKPEWAIFVGIISAIILFCVIIFGMTQIKTMKEAIITLILASIGIIGFVIFLLSPKTEEIYYKVIVDGTIDMNEFFQKYELIRTEGLIYVVRLIG